MKKCVKYLIFLQKILVFDVYEKSAINTVEFLEIQKLINYFK